MVIGAKKHYEAGKSVGAVPAEFLQALEEYVREEDKVGTLVEEYCELGPQATHRVSTVRVRGCIQPRDGIRCPAKAPKLLEELSQGLSVGAET
jgi:hypothetical protein